MTGAREKLLELICEHVSPDNMRLMELRDAIIVAFPHLDPPQDVVSGAQKIVWSKDIGAETAQIMEAEVATFAASCAAAERGRADALERQLTIERAHWHVAGTTVGKDIDECATCGRDLRDPVHRTEYIEAKRRIRAGGRG